MKNFLKNREVQVAIIGAAAVILANIIPAIFSGASISYAPQHAETTSGDVTQIQGQNINLIKNEYPPAVVSAQKLTKASLKQGLFFRTEFLIQIKHAPGTPIEGYLTSSPEAQCLAQLNPRWDAMGSDGMHYQGLDVTCDSSQPMPENATFTLSKNRK